VLSRAWNAGLSHIMVTTSDLATAEKALELIKSVEARDSSIKGLLLP
jgi:Tat protein secretion system quality control protein TatD with DNase activity